MTAPTTTPSLEVYNALTLALLAMAPPPLVAPAGPPPGIVLAQTWLAAAGGPGLVTLREGRAFLALSLRKPPGALDGRSSFGVHRAEQGRTPLRAGDDARPAPTTSTCRRRTRVRTDGRAVLATGPGYTLRIRVDGCTVVELLRLTTRADGDGRRPRAAREGRVGRR